MKKTTRSLGAVCLLAFLLLYPMISEGSTLQISNTPTSLSFPSLNVDGLNWKSSSTSISPIRVTDDRGTGEGWHLTVSATRITETGGLNLQMPSGSLILYAPTTATPAEGNLSEAPTVSTGSKAIDQSSFTIATAAVGTGLGSFDLSFPETAIKISLSPSARIVDHIHFSGSPTPYSTVITWTLNNTP